MKTKMNKVKDCLIVFWLSIFAMVLISAIEGNTPSHISQYDGQGTISQQDTIKKDTIKKEALVKKLNRSDQKELQEELEYQDKLERSQQIDKNMRMLDMQSIMIDSLLGKTDTTKVEL